MSISLTLKDRWHLFCGGEIWFCSADGNKSNLQKIKGGLPPPNTFTRAILPGDVGNFRVLFGKTAPKVISVL